MALVLYYGFLLFPFACGFVAAPIGLTLGALRHLSLIWLKRANLRFGERRIQTYQTWSNLLIWGILFAIALSPIAHAAIIFPIQEATTEHDGANLIQAIEKFHAQTGRYPDELTELVPLEMQRLPTLPGEYPFGYYLTEGGWYQLQYKLFYLGMVVRECNYHSGSKQWICKVRD